MSAVMVTGNRIGLMTEQPPTVVTTRALRTAGVQRPTAAASLVAPVSHLGFGAAGGLLYALLRRLVPDAPGGMLGVAFGLAVWAVSYVGWIPALGILLRPGATSADVPRSWSRPMSCTGSFWAGSSAHPRSERCDAMRT